MTHNTTLVSGFIDLRKYDVVDRLPLKTLDFFLEKAKPLLELPYPKVIFLEPDVYEIVHETFTNELTHFVSYPKENMCFWTFRERILQSTLPQHRMGNKDTHDYMMVQLQKTKWVDEATRLNPFQTDQFVWLDLGIFWVVKDTELFRTSCERLMNCAYDNVRVPGCWPLSQEHRFTADNVCWFFCGGLFGGRKDKLQAFHAHVLAKCLSVLYRENKWMWEVNIWYLVYRDHPELFDWYLADHNASMIAGYS